MESLPDKFEIAARTWAAEDGILDEARKLERQHNLDPNLRQDLEDATKEGDKDAYYAAMARFLEALREAREQ